MLWRLMVAVHQVENGRLSDRSRFFVRDVFPFFPSTVDGREADRLSECLPPARVRLD
jgi:hypothetical protein